MKKVGVFLVERLVSVERMEQAVSLFGSFDENIKLIENEFRVNVLSRGSELKVCGDTENVDKAVRAINGLLLLINKGEQLNDQNVRYVIAMVNDGDEEKIKEINEKVYEAFKKKVENRIS